MINMRARKAGVVNLEPTRQNKASGGAHSEVDPSAILNTPPVLDSFEVTMRVGKMVVVSRHNGSVGQKSVDGRTIPNSLQIGG